MRFQDIREGDDYAVVLNELPVEALRGTVTNAVSAREIVVECQHPDPEVMASYGGFIELTVRADMIYGEWNYRGYDADGAQLLKSWDQMTANRWEQVQKQRALADRLSKFGIIRGHQPFAGMGGRGNPAAPDPMGHDLHLNYDELTLLIDDAERGWHFPE